MQLPAAMVSRRPGRDRPNVRLDASPCGIITPRSGADLGPLLPGTVHVWAISVDSLDDPGSHRDSLSISEWRRAQAFRSERDRHRFIARRAVLRQLLGRYLALEPAKIEIDEGSGRKPAIAGSHRKRGATGVSPDIRFNCSHSDGMALLAFAGDLPVGVDLERVRPMPDAEDVARRFFSPQEYRVFMKVPPEDRLAAFYECWTAKEALIKALGHGLAMPLDSFTVSFSPDQPAQLVHLDTSEPGDWTLMRLRPSAGFSAALALSARGLVNVVTSWR
jgi:4'-phosphopantetheinyl transferase